jgi:hypothetical protein
MQKGPYFNNVQYISPLPEGYMQAASNIGRSYADAFRSVGQDIGAGIKQYQKNEEERSALGSTITQYIQNDPKAAEAIDPKVLEKFSTGKATLKDHKDIFASIGTNALIRDKQQRDAMQKQQSDLMTQNIVAAQAVNAENTRLRTEREQFNQIIAANTVPGENGTNTVNWTAVGSQLSAGGFNPYSDAAVKAKENQQKLDFSGPSATTVALGGGNQAAIVTAAPGQTSVINMPAPKAEVRTSESPIGKLWSDYYAAKSPEEQNSIAKQIENEAKTSAVNSQGKALTEGQANALTYSLRMKMNEGTLADVDYNPPTFSTARSRLTSGRSQPTASCTRPLEIIGSQQIFARNPALPSQRRSTKTPEPNTSRCQAILKRS